MWHIRQTQIVSFQSISDLSGAIASLADWGQKISCAFSEIKMEKFRKSIKHKGLVSNPCSKSALSVQHHRWPCLGKALRRKWTAVTDVRHRIFRVGFRENASVASDRQKCCLEGFVMYFAHVCDSQCIFCTVMGKQVSVHLSKQLNWDF